MREKPVSSMTRLRQVGSLAFEATLVRLRHWAQSIFLSDAERDLALQRLEADLIDLYLQTFAQQTRGSSVKLAQFFAQEAFWLSDHARERLAVSFNNLEPLNYLTVRKVFYNNFATYPDQLFMKFEQQAFAAASLGQVHNAQLSSGEHVAVKVLYPGVRENIIADFRLLKATVDIATESSLLQRSLRELEQRTLEETDYVQEVKKAIWFKQNFMHPNIYIPTTYQQFSSTHVITQEFCEGLSLVELSKQGRNRPDICRVLRDGFLYGVFDFGLIQGDPNPGNFIWNTQSQQLCMIDFGCVRMSFPQPVLNLFRTLLNTAMTDTRIEPSQWIYFYQSCGAETETMSAQERSDFVSLVVLPYVEALRESLNFRFKNEDGSSVEALRKALLRAVFHPRMQNFSVDFTILHRSLYGHLRLCESLTKNS